MQLQKRNTVADYNRFSVEEAVYQNGEKTVIRSHVKAPNAALIMPITKDGKFIFVKQIRTAIGNIETLEFPAGCFEKGESPEQTAKREFLEETGYMANSLQEIAQYDSSNGFCDEELFLFFTEDVTYVGKQQLDEDEEVEIIFLSEEEAIEKLLQGQIRSAATKMALLWYYAKKLEKKLGLDSLNKI